MCVSGEFVSRETGTGRDVKGHGRGAEGKEQERRRQVDTRRPGPVLWQIINRCRAHNGGAALPRS